MASSGVVVGTVSATNGATDPTPAYPSNQAIAPEDVLLLAVYCREVTDGVIGTPSGGWDVELASHRSSGGILALFSKVADGAETGTVTVPRTSGITTNDTIIAQIARFRGIDSASIMVNGPGTPTSFASTQNIGAVTGFTPSADDALIVFLGGKADDWTSVAAPTSMTEIAEPDSTLGTQAGLYWAYQRQEAAAASGSKTATVTGGAAAVSKAVMFALRMKPAPTGLPARMPESAGTVRHVATTGNDTTGTGTSGAPWATIQKAVDTMANGDIVHVHAGSYAPPAFFSEAGAVGAPKTFMAAPGDEGLVEFEWQGSGQQYHRFADCAYLRFRDLIFGPPTGITNVGMWISGNSHDLEFDRCLFRDGQQSNIYCESAGTCRVQWIDCDSTNAGLRNEATHNLDHGWYLGGDDHVLLRCQGFGNDAYGIQLYDGGNRSILAHCNFNGNGRSGVIVSGASATVKSNQARVWDCAGVDNGDNTHPSPAGYGIRHFWGGTAGRDNLVENFLAHGNLTAAQMPAPTGYTLTNLVTGDPLYTDASTHDYHLEPGSSAIDAGDGTFSDGFDRDGNALDASPDIGPFELVATVTYVDAAAVLPGAGTLTVAAERFRESAATLAGTGTLSTAAKRRRETATNLVGVGSLATAAKRDRESATSLAGAGTLATTARRERETAASLAGAAALTGTPARTRDGAAALAGAAAVATSAQRLREGAATLAGAGTLATTAKALRDAGAALPGAGAASAGGVRDRAADVQLAGVATLDTSASSTGTVEGQAGLAATSALVVAVGAVRTAQTALQGQGSLAAQAGRGREGAATLAGVATVATTASAEREAGASLAGAGTLAATGATAATIDGAVALTGQTTLAAIGSADRQGAAGLVGQGSLSAVAGRVRPAATAFAGSGQLAASGATSATVDAQVSLAATSSAATAPRRIRGSSSTVAGAVTLAASATALRDSSSTLAATGGLVVSASRHLAGAAELAAVGALDVDGVVVPKIAPPERIPVAVSPETSSATVNFGSA